jgi:hypothetical protein
MKQADAPEFGKMADDQRESFQDQMRERLRTADRAIPGGYPPRNQ